MADFTGEDLRGATIEHADLTGTRFHRSRLHDAEMHMVEIFRTRLRDVEIDDVEIDGEIGRLTINGIDIGAYVEAELNRRDPDRAAMRPTDPAGFRTAWTTLERLWAATVDRARRLDPARLHESVEGEWSFIETQRHLIFVTDCWVRRAIQGEPTPWHPLALPWDDMPDTPTVPRDRTARPALETVLAIRAGRAAGVRDYLTTLTQEQLDASGPTVDAPGWPPPRSFPVRECLRVLLNEEWQHRLYAERDLTALEAHP